MTTLTVWRVEDHEGTGECQRCGKTGLRWVTYLSDGSRVGGECAKRLMGWAPTKKNFSWVTGMTLLAEGDMSKTQRVALWQREGTAWAAISVNGNATAFGGIKALTRDFEDMTG